MTDSRPPWYLRHALELLGRSVGVLDTSWPPRERLEGAFQELSVLRYDELPQGRLSGKLLALRDAMRSTPAAGSEGTIAAGVKAMSDTAVQEHIALIRNLYTEVKLEWDALHP
jgi:hypothetical protein